MKIKNLSNYNSSVGIEVYDVDWNCSEEIIELGKICASQCIVFVDENIPTKTLYDSMMKWGDPSRALIHEYVLTKKIHGRHWREILLNLGYINNSIEDDIKDAVSIVSYKKGDKNKPVGIFQNGELEWHSDQCAFDDGQRIIGLQSVSDTVNSQTQFLCTHDAYESLSLDMQSLVKELIVKHKWFPNVMAPSLNLSQETLLHYNMVPLDGMETKLYRQTSTGLPGMKIPLHTFNGFVGMTMEESNKIMEEIKKSVFKEDYVYTQNWMDGQIVFMDQEITLHKRPTNIMDGDKRTMARVISYLNKIFNTEQSQRSSSIRYNGNFYNLDDFAKLVDDDRKKIFLQNDLL